MRRIDVAVGGARYPVCIGSGTLAQAGTYLKERGRSDRVVVIADAAVNKLYGQTLRRNLEGDSFQVDFIEVAPGEEQKSLESAGRLYRELAALQAERTTPVLALGGGVIGDLAGFVAATYQRGVPLVQLPTTLLAQVDSSIGGKVAVDHGQLKNMVGAFYQPRLVIADTDALKSLPGKELKNGLAEVIKSAAILDGRFFTFLEQNMEKITSLDEAVLEEIVYQSVNIKAGVVVEDELDLGLRNILNFGHTAGHAVESVSGFKIRHGEAVAIGMVAAARISNKMGLLGEKDVDRLIRLIERAGLLVAMPDFSVEAITQAIRSDKKVRAGKVRLVLLQSIGSAVINDDVPPSLVREVLAKNDRT